MNYFIDFDHTLYNTPKFTQNMLRSLAMYITNINKSVSFDEIYNLLYNQFKLSNGGIDNIYDLIKYLSDMPNIKFDQKEAGQVLNMLILNSSSFLFDDAIDFLEYLKNNGHKIYIFSYNQNEVYFQTLKISGSGILKYVNGLIPTKTLKGDVPLDFSKGIFIDDNPKDLTSIYKNHPLKIYRIRRKNDTYSAEETNLPIPEFSTLADLKKYIIEQVKMEE